MYVSVASGNHALAQMTIIAKWRPKIGNFEGTKVTLNDTAKHAVKKTGSGLIQP